MRSIGVLVAIAVLTLSCGQTYRYDIERDDALKAIATARENEIVAVDATDLDSKRRVRLMLRHTDEVRVYVNAQEGEEPSWDAPFGRVRDPEEGRLLGMRFEEDRWGGWLLWPGIAVFSLSMVGAIWAAVDEHDPLPAVPVVGPILWAGKDNPCSKSSFCIFDGRGFVAAIITAYEVVGLAATVVGYLYYRPTHEAGVIDDESHSSWRWPSIVAVPLPGGGVSVSAAGTF